VGEAHPVNPPSGSRRYAQAWLVRLLAGASGARCGRASSPWPAPFPPSPPQPVPRRCSATPRFYGTVRLPVSVRHLRTSMTSRCSLRLSPSQAHAGSPGSHTRCLRTCTGSLNREILVHLAVEVYPVLPSAVVLHLVGIPKYLLLAQQGMYFTAQYPTCTSPCQRFDAALASGST